MGVIQEGINRGLELTALGLQQDKHLQENVQHNINVEKAQKLTAAADELETQAQDYSTVNNTIIEGNNGEVSSLYKEGLAPVEERKGEYYETNNNYLKSSQSVVNRLRSEAINLNPGLQSIGALVNSNENYAGYHERLDNSLNKQRDVVKMYASNQKAMKNAKTRVKQKNTTVKWMENLKNRQNPDSFLGGKK